MRTVLLRTIFVILTSAALGVAALTAPAGAAVEPADVDLVQVAAVGVDHPDRAKHVGSDVEGDDDLVALR